jgi:hypothetical protein
MNGERGVALIEVAVVAPLLFLLAMGTLDFGRALATGIAIKEAAQEGVGNAVYIPSDPNEVVTRTVSAGSDIPISVDEVKVLCLASPHGFVEVEVAHEMELMTPFAGAVFGAVELRANARSEIVVEDPCVPS